MHIATSGDVPTCEFDMRHHQQIIRLVMSALFASIGMSPCAQQCPPTTQPNYCQALGGVCFQGFLRHYVSLVSFSTINNVTQLIGPLCPPGFTGYSNFRHWVGTVARGSNVLGTVGTDVASR